VRRTSSRKWALRSGAVRRSTRRPSSSAENAASIPARRSGPDSDPGMNSISGSKSLASRCPSGRTRTATGPGSLARGKAARAPFDSGKRGLASSRLAHRHPTGLAPKDTTLVRCPRYIAAHADHAARRTAPPPRRRRAASPLWRLARPAAGPRSRPPVPGSYTPGPTPYRSGCRHPRPRAFFVTCR